MDPLIFAKLYKALKTFLDEVDEDPELSDLALATPKSSVLQMSRAAEAVYVAAARAFETGYEAAAD